MKSIVHIDLIFLLMHCFCHLFSFIAVRPRPWNWEQFSFLQSTPTHINLLRPVEASRGRRRQVTTTCSCSAWTLWWLCGRPPKLRCFHSWRTLLRKRIQHGRVGCPQKHPRGRHPQCYFLVFIHLEPNHALIILSSLPN